MIHPSSARRFAVVAAFATIAVGGAAHASQTVIVELDAPPAAVHAAQAEAAGAPLSDAQIDAYRAQLEADQDTFLASLGGAGVAHTVRPATVYGIGGQLTTVPTRYSLVYNGVALVVDEAAIAAIEAMPGVKAVHRETQQKLHLDRAVDYVRAPEVYGAVAEVTPTATANEGLEGRGIYIAVLDSGIDWSHPMFGGDPTPPRLGLAQQIAAVPTNDKIVYYMPLIDGAYDDYGHGTHVAADAAGYLGFEPGPDGIPNTADDVAMHGVAPQARIMGYKVCNAAGTCLNPDTLLAIEDAVSPRTLTGFAKPVAHVINLSLGGEGGPDSPTSVACDNAVLLGAIVVSSAGNEGPGLGTIGAPSAGRRVISVGANNDPGVFPNAIDIHDPATGAVDPNQPTLPAILAPDSNAGQPINSPIVGHYVYAGLADTPDQVPATVLGNICLVMRGSTVEAADNGTGLFANKAAPCAARGATGVVVFNNAPGPIGSVLAPAAIPVLTVSQEDGLYLRDTLGFDALGVSLRPIALGPVAPSLYSAQMTGFSSRGPVLGLGQVKPDVTGPGDQVLSATTMVGVPANSMQSATRYIAASGTSFSGPIVAGLAALLKQANPAWGGDEVRAAMMNSATNLRDAAGVAKPDGILADRVLDQGAGLIDSVGAVGLDALMGVPGDGVFAPTLLASHSFGALPVLGNRVVNTFTVDIDVVDVGGSGGTYALSTIDNRELSRPGVSATISPASVTVSAYGRASATLTVTIDGDVVRDAVSFLDVQGYVVATGANQTLRMPFFLRATPSLPAAGVPSTTTQTTHSGTVLAGDQNLFLAGNVTYVDVEAEATPDTVRLVGHADWTNVGGLPDLDMFLLGPTGDELASSTNAGGPETIDHVVTGPGTHTFRVSGWLNAPTDFDLVITRHQVSPPTAHPVSADYVEYDGTIIDFDGLYDLSWTTNGSEIGFELEHSYDGGPWTLLAELPASSSGYSVYTTTEGLHSYRVRAVYPGQLGHFVTSPSNETSVLYDRRRLKNITGRTDTFISSASYSGGIFSVDLHIENTSTKTYYPAMDLVIYKVKSASKSVTVRNADNGGLGTSCPAYAAFSYSHLVGSDAAFTPAEVTGARTLEFNNLAGELFTFKAKVFAHRDVGASYTPGSTAPDSDEAADDASIFDVVVNPLLGTVDVTPALDLLP